MQRGPLPEKSWRIYKRYNDFVKLHSQLQISGIDIRLPPKKIIGNLNPEFIAERQKQLQVIFIVYAQKKTFFVICFIF